MRKYEIQEAIDNPIDFVQTLLDSYQHSLGSTEMDYRISYLMCNRIRYLIPTLRFNQYQTLEDIMTQIGIGNRDVRRIMEKQHLTPLCTVAVPLCTVTVPWFTGEASDRIEFLQKVLKELPTIQRGRKHLPDITTYPYPEYHVIIQNKLSSCASAALDGRDTVYTELMYRKQHTSEKQPFWAYIGRR